MAEEIRVRFAPSPTGALHIGGVRTALYNYLYARKNNGTFVLRIEDTDQARFVPGAEEYINKTFKWLGIVPDEGVGKNGQFGPYRQSERREVYQKYATQLLEAGKAYYAFDTPDELEKMRQRLKESGADNLVYDRFSRKGMRNSLTLNETEVEKLLKDEAPYVIRLKVDGDDDVTLADLIRGQVRVQKRNIDDKVLLKSDGMPTYHLANVVDDHLMKISHVIRGEEWLPSAPLHVLLYEYLGWSESMPEFAHLPLLLKPDGNGKLSKRDADKHGYPVFPLDWTDPNTGAKSMGFREQGYLPEAMINFLALLGWNPGTEQELFSLGELIDIFSIERINKSGSKFDLEKARWFNQQYLKHVPDEALAKDFIDLLKENGISASIDKAQMICHLLKERVTFPHEFLSSGKYFFEAPADYDEKVIRKKWNEEARALLSDFLAALDTLNVFNKETALSTLKNVLEKSGSGMGKIMPALRVSVTGVSGGPDLMAIMDVLGKEEVIKRINLALSRLK